MLGLLFTSSKPWTLSLEEERFALTVDGSTWSESVLRLGGISNVQATELLKALSVAIAAARRRLLIAELSQQFPTKLDEVVRWVSDATNACREQLKRRGWLSHEFKTQLSTTTPTGLADLLAEPEIELLLKAQQERPGSRLSLAPTVCRPCGRPQPVPHGRGTGRLPIVL